MAETRTRQSHAPTPYAVRCWSGLMEGDTCGLVYLTEDEYDRQMDRPDRLWQCPRCGADAEWDDQTYELAMEATP